jgi:hypothetical protein
VQRAFLFRHTYEWQLAATTQDLLVINTSYLLQGKQPMVKIIFPLHPTPACPLSSPGHVILESAETKQSFTNKMLLYKSDYDAGHSFYQHQFSSVKMSPQNNGISQIASFSPLCPEQAG